MPTPGRLVSHRGFDIGHGFTLVVPTGAYVSWIGKQLDGTGTKPDVQVNWSYDDLLAACDPQLATAIQQAREPSGHKTGAGFSWKQSARVG